MGVTAFAVTLFVRTFTANRLIQRRLRVSLVLLAGYIAINLFFVLQPELASLFSSDAPSNQNSGS